MADYRRKAFCATVQQDAFLKRKVRDLRKLMPRGKEHLVTQSSVLQGLIDHWMKEDAVDRRAPITA